MDDHATAPSTEPNPTASDDAPSQESTGTWRMPEHRVRFCTLESCQPDGGRELARLLEERLGVKVEEQIYDGSTRLEALECIGLCDMRQAVLIDDEPVIGLSAVMRTIDELLDDS